ncbi:MAG: ribonuclease P protein component [Alphaproteobacteria bacterium]|nr:ribonuclease P protein component [Alphaproteobacteria bacterium]
MKHKTIRNHKDFFAAPDDVHVFVVRTDCFVVKTKSAKKYGDSRYGLVVTKKNFKLAVHRNRAKRLLRDWVAFNEDLMLPDLDYILIAKTSILNIGRENGREMVYNAFKQIAKLYEQNVKNR